ncbi:DNA repair protein RadA [Treponema sp. OMZ 840]|uniref:DNA repair protein RadA n=1 Tax=Treponema sp. OMZ 840 TaxID=244313 RepID=UPI003D8BD532
MAKKKSVSTFFKCTSCGYTQPRWMGRCPECGEWNTLRECIAEESPYPAPFGSHGLQTRERIKPLPLSAINPAEGERFFTGIGEFDRVLGGGAVKRSAVLIGGEPGIGKSTLLLQTAAAIRKNTENAQSAVSGTRGRVLYVSGEEAASQIRARADRLGAENAGIEILCTNRLEDIENALNALNPLCVIVDSIQTVFSADAGSIPGTVNQLKYCAAELTAWVKERDAVLFMSAHVTKDGSIAGPKALEHLVDTVISFERNDDHIRFLRSLKNRFGSIDELGIFSMGERGLTAVEDPSSLFIVRRSGTVPPGTAVVPVFEGSRVFLVEIQALTVPAKAALTRVYSEKIDNARVSRVAAVLEKRAGLRFSDQDIYINVAGGVRLTESAIDAALAAALYSARTDIAPPEKTAVTGELSLAGEIRPVHRLKQRAKAAATLGFTRLLGPEKEEDVVHVCGIQDLIKTLFS